MLEEIRKRLHAVPFSPFVIRLTDGRALTVNHPDFLWMPKPTRIFFFDEADDASERVNVLHIVSVRGMKEMEAA
jgi:hypothetical protein